MTLSIDYLPARSPQAWMDEGQTVGQYLSDRCREGRGQQVPREPLSYSAPQVPSG